MEKKIFLVVDLGGGDGGKGGVVHKICTQTHAHTVIKVGGGQGSHGVRTTRGENFNFSHFGCGTFEGVHTHISDQMVIDPIALKYEGNILKYNFGIQNVFQNLTIDENVLCTTPYHRISSRLKELARKSNPKGTIGVGIGEAYSDSEKIPGLAIRVRDLGKIDLHEKIAAVRHQKLGELSNFSPEDFLLNDRQIAEELIASLRNENLPKILAENLALTVRDLRVVGKDYLAETILGRDGTVVVESSHGILTDRYYGFHPYTSRLRTVPMRTLNLLDQCGYEGEIFKLAVTRAYQIRHGAGPMVTADPKMSEVLLPGSSKEENRWQGKVRVGPLDFVSMRYSVNVCGGAKFFDGICLTWWDQIQKSNQWQMCDEYTGTANPEFFLNSREVTIRHGEDAEQLAHQEKLGQLLLECGAKITSAPIPPDHSNKTAAINLCHETFQEKLGIPLAMISFGPTDNDKICL